ncbi:12-oxophytodienoate reductase 1 [Geranomyces variabilis]|nr:12-oxophytodienoate reductase 1 [Geranomyces variabilis]
MPSATSSATTDLFSPLVLSPQISLAHRIVLAPLTRCRAVDGNVANDLMAEYYAQRATEGGLLISEGTVINPYGYTGQNIPGIYTDAQEAGWRKVCERVAEKRAVFFAQLWHCGRSTLSENMPNGEAPWSSSAIQPNVRGRPMPREMPVDVIHSTIGDFGRAAERARRAGFDGIEIHSANGYLVDQFLQNGTNHRNDEYGGSIENRSKFLLETVEACIAGVGGQPGRVGVRLAPWGTFGDISTTDTTPLFTYVLKRLSDYGLAYVHLVEPRINGATDRADAHAVSDKSLRVFRDVYHGNFMVAGGFVGDVNEEGGNAAAKGNEAVATGYADFVSYGRWFIANPDFVMRLRKKRPLSPYKRATFYTQGKEGYTDYSAYEQPKI